MASILLRYVCGENTAASCAHRHIHPMHFKQFICDIMCAEKKANFEFLADNLTQFRIRKIFLEAVLQMLLICVCHFSFSSTVTPSRRCFETCSTGVVSNFRFKRSCFFPSSGVYVSSPSICVLFLSDSVPSDFYTTIQRHHIDFVVNPYVYYLCSH